jgi:hypothetical protein
MGMQQWPTSVMIEVVAFGDSFGKAFMRQLQSDAVAFVAKGNDAMLHWGLENDQVTAGLLNQTPALLKPLASTPSLNQLGAFRQVRKLIKTNLGTNPAGLFPIFDNTFTSRLAL